MVPDSGRATVRNGNDACFSYFQIIWQLILDFLTLQDKHNLRILSVIIKLICTRCETNKTLSITISLTTYVMDVVKSLPHYSSKTTVTTNLMDVIKTLPHSYSKTTVIYLPFSFSLIETI
jgi:hypothetical protein